MGSGGFTEAESNEPPNIADYRRMQERLTDVRRLVQDLSASASSKDGTVTVTVGAHGNVTNVTFRDDAFRRSGTPDQLARTVMEVVQQATSTAQRKLEKIMSGFLPEGVSVQDVMTGDIDPSGPRPRGSR